MEIYYVKKLGHKRFAPYVTVEIAGSTFDARIDTGADLTAIPKHILENLEPSGITRVSAYDGSHKNVLTYKSEVKVAGEAIYLKEIITTESNVGTLGLDVLDHFVMLFEPGKVLLESVN